MSAQRSCFKYVSLALLVFAACTPGPRLDGSVHPGIREIRAAGDNPCLRVLFVPDRTTVRINDLFEGRFELTPLCGSMRFYPLSTFTRNLYLTAWLDETRTRAPPLVPPYPAGPPPPAQGIERYPEVRPGSAQVFRIAERANTIFPGPGRYTLVADYFPFGRRLIRFSFVSPDEASYPADPILDPLIEPLVEQIVTHEDGPFNRSRVSITVVE